MPTYDYKCTACKKLREDDCSMLTFKEHRPKCLACGAECKYVYIPTIAQVVFKDGPSGSWPSKGNHYQQYRKKRDTEMKKRQRDRYGEPKRAIPNYQGQQTESWTEAQNLAMNDKERIESTGSDPLSVGATYNEKIAEEKNKGLSK